MQPQVFNSPGVNGSMLSRCVSIWNYSNTSIIEQKRDIVCLPASRLFFCFLPEPINMQIEIVALEVFKFPH